MFTFMRFTALHVFLCHSFIRKTWQLVLVLTLFAEHIMLKHRNTVYYARRLHLVMGTCKSVASLTVCASWILRSFSKIMLTFKKLNPWKSCRNF